MNAFLIALAFLTRIPVGQQLNYATTELSRSVLWYPFVGLLIGALLVSIAFLNSFFDFSAFVSATIILGVWIIITGALHWDGLADAADAWLAGGDQEKTLAILRDTHCGTAAIVVVGVCLLVFTAALTSLLDQNMMMTLLLAPVLARSAALLLLMTTPYARESGLGKKLTQHLSRVSCGCVILITLLLTIFLLKWQSIPVIVGLMVLIFLLRRLMLKRIGGMTGDTIGALIVISEMMVMLLSLVNVQY